MTRHTRKRRALFVLGLIARLLLLAAVAFLVWYLGVNRSALSLFRSVPGP